MAAHSHHIHLPGPILTANMNVSGRRPSAMYFAAQAMTAGLKLVAA
jgi:hypothetical protein